MSSLSDSCTFCGKAADPSLPLPRFGVVSCASCARRLGERLTTATESVTGVWPLLAPDEDDAEPEPRVQAADGSSRQLKDVTAELKASLPLEARAQLAEMYGE